MNAKIFLTGLALVAVATFTNAQNADSGKGNGNGTCNGTAKSAAFIDANKNGICDTYENRTANGKVSNGKGKRNGNGTGTCTGQGTGQGKGKGKNIVDANKNGVCDTYEANQKK